MFSVGDKVMYGNMGVCTVVGLGVPDIPGAERECYVLKPQYVANSKVYAPVEDNPVTIRALLSPAEAQTLIDNLPKVQAFADTGDKQTLHNTYRDAIRSSDSRLLAKLIKTLHMKRQQMADQKKLMPSVEKEYFDTAEKILYGELAMALQMPIEQVEGYIFARLGPGKGVKQVVAS